MKDMNRDIEFLFEMGALRYMTRQWHRFGGIQFANNTEHMYRVVWIALVIAAREGVKDTGKIIKMALAHDIAESRSGDVDYLSRQYVDRHEQEALADILDDTSVQEEFLNLLEEYEKRESIEAKIVKDADNLDVDMELREQAAKGEQLQELWGDMRGHVMETKLFTKTAKEMFVAIRAANPHDWHKNSRKNRINGGDWQKKK